MSKRIHKQKEISTP